MPALYIPRGYISTQQALGRLCEARHADLLSGATERDAEERRLSNRRILSKPSPIIPINTRDRNGTDSGPIEFTREEDERLKALAAIRWQIHSFREAAASDIRTALAEGDLSAMLLTNDGREVPINTSAWRAKDGLEGVWTGQMSVHLPFGIGATKGQAFVKEADFEQWMRAIMETGTHRLRANASGERLGMPESAGTPLIKAQMPNKAAELPLWLTPMEAVAWIVARDSRIVGYASSELNAIRSFVIDHVLPDGKQVSGNVAAPAGISLHWLDAFAAFDVNATLPTDKALSELLSALRSGTMTARGIWIATRERRDMGSDEWHGLVLESPPQNTRVLLPYRLNPTALAKHVEMRWRDLLLPRQRILVLWPDMSAERPRGTNPPEHACTDALENSESGPGSHRSISAPKPDVAVAALRKWYIDRRDRWPDDRKHPSQDRDLVDARENFPSRRVSREAIRAMRAEHAPAAWTSHGRRKLARE